MDYDYGTYRQAWAIFPCRAISCHLVLSPNLSGKTTQALTQLSTCVAVAKYPRDSVSLA